MQTQPNDIDRLIQDALAELGSSADATLIAEKVRRLDIGLPREDEFSVMCSWLGQCRLIHKLDQQQAPIVSKIKFQVPDLLALFTSVKSPVLIEVKSNIRNTLSLQPKYLERLQNYAEMLNLPLLIAWKYHGVWTLFEARHLKKSAKNFNITISTAMQENLLGVLAGDVAYKIGKGAGVHLRFRKDKLIGHEVTKDCRTEQWVMTIDDVGFTDFHGTRRTDLSEEVQTLFTAWDLNEHEEHTNTHMQLSFVADSNTMQFAHRALGLLLNWELPEDQKPHWRHLLRNEQVTANMKNFSEALEKALQQTIVSHIFHMKPRSMPDFFDAE